MAILTTAFADSADRLFVITRGHSSLGEAIGYNSDGSKFWKKNVWFDEQPIDSFNFDKSFDDLMRLFENCGFRSVSTKLQTGKMVTPRNDETSFSEGWLINPSVVKSVAKSLEKANLESIIAKWKLVRKKIQDKEGLDIGSFDDLCLPNIENLKMFLAKSAIEQNYLVMLHKY